MRTRTRTERWNHTTVPVYRFMWKSKIVTKWWCGVTGTLTMINEQQFSFKCTDTFMAILYSAKLSICPSPVVSFRAIFPPPDWKGIQVLLTTHLSAVVNSALFCNDNVMLCCLILKQKIQNTYVNLLSLRYLVGSTLKKMVSNHLKFWNPACTGVGNGGADLISITSGHRVHSVCVCVWCWTQTGNNKSALATCSATLANVWPLLHWPLTLRYEQYFKTNQCASEHEAEPFTPTSWLHRSRMYSNEHPVNSVN